MHSNLTFKVGFVLVCFLALFYGFQGFYPDLMYVFSNAFPPLIAGAAFASSILALEKYWGNFKESFSLVWLCFASGLGLWFLGEASWAVYTLFLGVKLPYPSVADVFWLGGYVPMFVALFLYVKTFWQALSSRVVYATTLAVVFVAVLVYALLAAPVYGGEEGLAVVFADFAYPVLDAVLLHLALLGFAIFFKGKIGKSWLFISAGIVSFIMADFLFSYTTAYETYYCGHPLELLFHFGDILMLLAFYTHAKEL